MELLLNCLIPFVLGILLICLSAGKRQRLQRMIHYEISFWLLIIEAIWIPELADTGFLSPLSRILPVVLMACCAAASAFLKSRAAIIPGVIGVGISVLLFATFGMQRSVSVFLHSLYLLILCVLGLIFGVAPAAAGIVPENTPAAKASSAQRAPSAAHMLRCLSGAFAGAEFELNCGEVLTIGSDPEYSQIVLPGQTIAAAHCKLWFDSSSMLWCVVDLTHSVTHGNDERTPDSTTIQTLPSGAVLSIGNGPELNRFRLI